MSQSFKLPDLGEGLTEGEVARWLVAEGQEIAEDDPLVEIQTDKATVDIPSPYAGTVLRILVAEGEVAPVGAVLVVIGDPGEALAEELSPPPPGADGQIPPTAEAPSARVQATPLVRRIASELDVELATVEGTGQGGRITEADVRAAAGPAPLAEGRREPLRGVRRLIAEHMARAHREVPPVTWVEECDFEAVPLEQLLATVVKACADELVEFPGAERTLRRRLDRVPRPLRPRGRGSDRSRAWSCLSFAAAIRGRSLRSRPRSSGSPKALAPGRSRPEEVRGSTFTVTSAGKLAGLFQTPIVNHPEVAILSIGRVAPRRCRSATGKWSCARRARSRSRSTTVSSTARARPRSASQ